MVSKELRDNIDLAAKVAALLTVAYTWLASLYGVIAEDANHATLILTASNFIVTVVFLVLIKNIPELKFAAKNESHRTYWRLLDVNISEEGNVIIGKKSHSAVEQANFHEERVNLLVEQFKTHLQWLAAAFLILYGVCFLDNQVLFPLENQGSSSEKLSGLQTGLRVIRDLANLWGACFVALAFMVLYDNTLNETDNKKSTDYQWPFILGAILVSIFYGVILWWWSSDVVYNRLLLLIGSITGLSYALLFGRYLSMEHQLWKFLGIHYSKWKRVALRLAVVGILPIYALVQPLFPVFRIYAFSEPGVFANWVFALCLIGKGAFFFVTWYFMKEKLMHYYLHLVLCNHGVPEEFNQCFKSNP